jgi:hypothetical protein
MKFSKVLPKFRTYGQLKQQTEELSDLDATLDLGREIRKSVMGKNFKTK